MTHLASPRRRAADRDRRPGQEWRPVPHVLGGTHVAHATRPVLPSWYLTDALAELHGNARPREWRRYRSHVTDRRAGYRTGPVTILSPSARLGSEHAVDAMRAGTE